MRSQKEPKIAATSKVSSARRTSADTSQAVDAFMRASSHPLKPELEILRQRILGVHPTIGEGIKWNVPSFRTVEYFATFHLREKVGFSVVLHLGAKARAGDRPAIDDPDGLLQWLGKDRALVRFAAPSDVESLRDSFTSIVKQWITFV